MSGWIDSTWKFCGTEVKRVWFQSGQQRSAQSTFSSACILFHVPSICTFPFVFLCPCSGSSSPPPHIFPFKDTVERGQGVGGRGVGVLGGGVEGHTQVCWLTNRLLFVQIDGHTHDTLCYTLTKTSAWLGPSWLPEAFFFFLQSGSFPACRPLN